MGKSGTRTHAFALPRLETDMVAIFMALMFVGCVIVDYFVDTMPHTVAHRKDDVRFEPGLGLCMADGGAPVKKETK